ncbi:glycosyltransferase [Marinicella rhabdoformis]|uniref:glycosyltransferase n=1 Tax=Marinicella rhabdoformis TaxID=2580566 RepID=UPI0012AEDDF7|nr:glycosyltransferase [Marinicella rhabdoformis]
MNPSSVLTLHDLFLIKGGGERLIHDLCLGLNSDLVTGAISEQGFDLSQLSGQVTNLNGLSGLSGIKTWSLARAFKKYRLDKAYANVIYSGVASPLAINNINAQKHVFYCHTPPRFVYDKKAHYSKDLSWLGKQALHLLNTWFQPQYEQAVNQMDVVLTNSQYVKKRIKNTLSLDAQVVYPPCDTQQFRWKAQGDYFLSLARLDGLKRIKSIVEAFKKMPDKKVVIASGGPESEALQKLAQGHDNISFTGWLSEEKLLDLLGGCLATIYVPEDEDFGMTPVESMAAGKPVICSDHGGPLESVINQETGFYADDEHLVESIIASVSLLTPQKASSMRDACEHRALDFDTHLFLKNISKYLI